MLVAVGTLQRDQWVGSDLEVIDHFVGSVYLDKTLTGTSESIIQLYVLSTFFQGTELCIQAVLSRLVYYFKLNIF